MKKVILLIIAGCFMAQFAHAQKTELYFNIHSGLFSFGGQRAEQVTFINYSPTSKHNNAANNPYGSVNGPILGLGFELKRITPYRLIVGLALGYEFLKSNINITGINEDSFMYDAYGHDHINQNFINLAPMVGYRIGSDKLSLDVIAGMDMAYGFKLREKATSKTHTGQKIKIANKRNNFVDVRPRLQLAVNFWRVNISLAYAFGLIPYDGFSVNGSKDNQVFSRIWRFGAAYRLK